MRSLSLAISLAVIFIWAGMKISPALVPKTSTEYTLMSYDGWHWQTVVRLNWLGMTWLSDRSDCPRDFKPWGPVDG